MPKRYIPLWVLILTVLCCGLFFPKLMDTDAPEYAGVAMHMYQTGRLTEIVNRSYATGMPFAYLEKPHMIFWSALPGYALFGVHDYAYRLVSVLLTLFAALATFKTAALLYDRSAGAMAAIFFATAQATLLASHDVRTDSLLTSFCILAIWQMMCFITRKKGYYLVSAGFLLACAIATKGMIAVLVCGCAILCYLLGKKDLKTLFSPKWLLLLFSAALFLSPVLYFYYCQFDKHPGLLVNGRHGVSGVKFLLWSQSFDRFSGTGDFSHESPEFIFFFHTLLWALLPWSILCYGGTAMRLKELWKTKGRSFRTKEQLSFAGVWIMLLFMSLSRIKLPHYINVLFPLMCIFTAGYLRELHASGKVNILRGYMRFQWLLNLLLIAAALALNLWAFRIQSYAVITAAIILVIAAVLYYRRLKPDLPERVWIPSALVILLLNFLLNTNFYPQVARYQGGSAMAGRIAEKHYAKADIYLYGYVCRSFDFYMGSWAPMLDNEAILRKEKEGRSVLLFTDQENLDRLGNAFSYSILESLPDFHITALDLNFINPATRAANCGKVYLVKVLAGK